MAKIVCEFCSRLAKKFKDSQTPYGLMADVFVSKFVSLSSSFWGKVQAKQSNNISTLAGNWVETKGDDKMVIGARVVNSRDNYRTDKPIIFNFSCILAESIIEIIWGKPSNIALWSYIRYFMSRPEYQNFFKNIVWAGLESNDFYCFFSTTQCWKRQRIWRNAHARKTLFP